MILRSYQTELKFKVYREWSEGKRNVLMVLPTGLGKTKIFCNMTEDAAIIGAITDMVKTHLNINGGKLPTAIAVHRKELVQQISIALAEEGIDHNIIAPPATILKIKSAHRTLFRKEFYRFNSTVSVISVDTLKSRILRYQEWAKTIRFWITDEAHHVLKTNKWGTSLAYFTNAIGLGVTASPERLDRRGLGSHTDGVFDSMVIGPSTGWGIDNGFLSTYNPVITAKEYQDHLKEINEDRDFTHEEMQAASTEGKLVGNIVNNCLLYAKGKQTIIFASTTQDAYEIEKDFLTKGVKAKTLTSKTDDADRFRSLQAFKNREIEKLINVDLFDEGLDVPGIECVSMGRPTKSLGKYLQMVGRGLRPIYAKGYDLSTVEGRLEAQRVGPKPHAILIDHVGNIKRHGRPCMKRQWTLDRIRKRKKRIELIRICKNWECNKPFERYLTECPYCGHKDEKGGGGGSRSLEEVDGDLFLMSREMLIQMEANTKLEEPNEIAQRVSAVAGGAAGVRAMHNQRERIETQQLLVAAIAEWAGRMRTFYGYSDRSINKWFYSHFEDKAISDCLAEPKEEMLKTIEELHGLAR